MALDPITAGLDLGGTLFKFGEAVINRIWPDPTVKEQAKLELTKLAQQGELARLAAETGLLQAQIETNKAQAENPSVFVSGPRPFIMWVCGATFALHYLGFPIANFVLAATGQPQIIIDLDVSTIMTVMLGLLGLVGAT
jgi:hypothetical protein